ncbi:MAG: beta-glucuronidase [Verrucomicrobia bacterium]|nr:beta-glucuronidase [Verrucomicrobiota bacterium]MCH8513337.1 beta-glucuronidase [Kiritimatiellia bacterium]
MMSTAQSPAPPDSVPRHEHPRPQFQRETWLNLNGWWNFAFDFGGSGEEQGWPGDPSGFASQILVPFCPESTLSRIGHMDFMSVVWYHREIEIPENWAGRNVRLHFGAVDYDCSVWVNGLEAGRHRGAGSSFHFEITALLKDGKNQLVVRAQDDARSRERPQGKQSPTFASQGCHYTRTTGIWQTVWLEALPASHIESVRVVPDLDGDCFVLTPMVADPREQLRFRAVLCNSDGTELSLVLHPANATAPLRLHIPNPRPWSPSDPWLYNLRFELVDDRNEVIDRVQSYAGLRKVHIEGNRFFLNNEPLFLRFVLDQGFYPDGIWTAPSDAELRADIERSLAVGFNGARLHQKVFEERYHYWADRLGYLTWGEFHDWGVDFKKPQALLNHQREWTEVLLRDVNHPSILAWTPFNETMDGAYWAPEAHRQALAAIYDLTRAIDPTRPCHDTSGHVHVKTDIFSIHDYEQDPEKFADRYKTLDPANPATAPVREPNRSAPYTGQPYVVAEYGGTWWDAAAEPAPGDDQKKSWGYGQRPTDIEEVYHRIEELTATLIRHPEIAGFCYTQLTDVEQEQNGIYTYDRQEKFDPLRLKNAFTKTSNE